MTADRGPATLAGTVEPDVADEFPGLALHWVKVAASDGPSPDGLVWQLHGLADRYRGAAVVAMRTKPIPAAYRTFYRHIGLDPDTTRIPSEQAALDRLFHGTFRSHGLVADALLIALVETGVPVWAFDGERVEAESLGIRTALAGETLLVGGRPRPLEQGTLVIADRHAILGVLFGAPSPGPAVSRQTTEIVLYTVAVAGVPAIHVEEALWLAVEALQMGR